MKINRISIYNFRNLKKIDIEPVSGMNIFTGDNAQGKTNLLEAIYILSAGNSFRNTGDKQLINYDAGRYQVKAWYEFQERNFESSLLFDEDRGKNFTINNKKSAQNNPDRLKVVLFNPDDLFLVKGSPSKRRAFLDFIIQQLSGDYAYNLGNYAKILKKRNLLLKNEQTNQQSYTIINQLFIETAIKVILQRINFVNILDEIARPLFAEINGGQNKIKIRYALSFPVENDKINLNILQAAMQDQLIKKFPEELKRKQSLVGPHIDDINLYQNGRSARIFASQGQQRNLVICLKLAEVYAFKRVKGYYPVFLLDEVLAELDEQKRFLLLDHLSKAEFQSFLSSVSLGSMDHHQASLYTVKDGQLTRKEQ